MKSTKDIPYSHEESERAAGLQPDKDNRKIKFTDFIYAGKDKMEDIKKALDN